MAKAHVYMNVEGKTKLIAADVTFETLPRIDDFISLSLPAGERGMIVEEVWHIPHAISPLARLVVAETASRLPTEASPKPR